jgi:hypothetical protein
MKSLISVLESIPVKTVKPFTSPALDTEKLNDPIYLLDYSAKLIEAKKRHDEENGGGEREELIIGIAHLLSRLPEKEIGSVAEESAKRARTLAGFVVLSASELASTLSRYLRGEASEKDMEVCQALVKGFEAYESKGNFSEACRIAKLSSSTTSVLGNALRDDCAISNAKDAKQNLPIGSALGHVKAGEMPWKVMIPPAPEAPVVPPAPVAKPAAPLNEKKKK